MAQPASNSVRDHYLTRAALIDAAAATAIREWSTVDRNAIWDSWAAKVPTVWAVTAAAQRAAAAQADPYLAAMLAEEANWPASTLGDVTSTIEGALSIFDTPLIPDAFAGFSGEGTDLAQVLLQAAVVALQAIKSGVPVDRAMATGLVTLESIVLTEVADSGREADLVSNTTHQVMGYVRVTVPPSCSRCVILAGRWYRWSSGFLRHPRCDCIMVPAPEGATPLQSPRHLYESMTPTQRTAAGWSAADQASINLGADIGQVTNIHRGGLYVAGGRQFTREATTRRGRFGGYERNEAGQLVRRPTLPRRAHRNTRTARITPRQIFREAGDDRALAIRLLQLYGYIL
jgi:hypothetical protein